MNLDHQYETVYDVLSLSNYESQMSIDDAVGCIR